MATGEPLGFTPFGDALDPGDPPGRPDPEVADPGPITDRLMRGYVVLWATDEYTGNEIRWNHLKGDALILNWRDGTAWEYNAFGIEAVYDENDPADPNDDVPKNGDPTGHPDDAWDGTTLCLDNEEFKALPAKLVLDFFGMGSDRSSAPGGPGVRVVAVVGSFGKNGFRRAR